MGRSFKSSAQHVLRRRGTFGLDINHADPFMRDDPVPHGAVRRIRLADNLSESSQPPDQGTGPRQLAEKKSQQNEQIHHRRSDLPQKLLVALGVFVNLRTPPMVATPSVLYPEAVLSHLHKKRAVGHASSGVASAFLVNPSYHDSRRLQMMVGHFCHYLSRCLTWT